MPVKVRSPIALLWPLVCGLQAMISTISICNRYGAARTEPLDTFIYELLLEHQTIEFGVIRYCARVGELRRPVSVRQRANQVPIG